MVRYLIPLLLLVPLMLVSACPADSSIPGEVLGSYRFNATLESTNCPPVDVPDGGFSFTATVSQDNAQAYFTVSDFARDATIEDQSLTSVHEAVVQFDSCGEGCNDSKLHETVKVTLLSASQLATTNCSALLPDGTITLDGGTPPSLEPGNFNAQRACGRLVDVVIPGENEACACETCNVVYLLDGELEQ